MSRKRRTWIEDSFYHVTSRGNRREELFRQEEDFKFFLHVMKETNRKTPFDLAAYCLMTNHFHLQIRSQQQPLSKVMFHINKRYADYYNNKNGLSGHVFEKRYYADHIDSPLGMLKVSRYIHLNPLEAGIIQDPIEYRWSSYYDYMHSNQKRFSLLHPEFVLESFLGEERDKRKKYEEYMEADEEIKLEVPVTSRNLSNG
ncbi:transposase [Oceanobacillus salinisoli]|uniref:transposase n=1 Tax=Oceanobacillus salinisoli TaxID=2678611 RepID=UPI0012E27B90|nr:transposase [Oceanobacillus salinisoli]